LNLLFSEKQIISTKKTFKMKKTFPVIALFMLFLATAMFAENNYSVVTKPDVESRCTRSGTIETSTGSISFSITAQSCAEVDAALLTLAATFSQM
jgi:hypothetical protein